MVSHNPIQVINKLENCTRPLPLAALARSSTRPLFADVGALGLLFLLLFLLLSTLFFFPLCFTLRCPFLSFEVSAFYVRTISQFHSPVCWWLLPSRSLLSANKTNLFRVFILFHWTLYSCAIYYWGFFVFGRKSTNISLDTAATPLEPWTNTNRCMNMLGYNRHRARARER